MKKILRNSLRLSMLMLVGGTLVSSILTSCGQSEVAAEKIDLTKDDAYDLKASAELKNDEDIGAYTFESENVDVARVSRDGIVVGTGEGDTEVSAYDENGSLKATFDFSVSTYEELETNEVFKGITAGGILIDINTGGYLAKGNDYTFTLSVNTVEDQTIQVVFSNPEIASFSIENDAYYIHCAKVGDTIMKIFNAEGILAYRNVLRVRYAMSSKYEVLDYLKNVDYFDNWGALDGTWQPNCRITFTGDDSALFTGTDGGVDLGNITFHFQFIEDERIDEDRFYFVVSDRSNSATTLQVSYFNVNRTGSPLHLYSDNQILDVFEPETNK